jgi:hypothetical protein
LVSSPGLAIFRFCPIKQNLLVWYLNELNNEEGAEGVADMAKETPEV